MGISLIYNDKSKLTSIEDLISKDKIEIATEDMKYNKPQANCGVPICDGNIKSNTIYKKVINKNKTASWTFFLQDCFDMFHTYNDFILLMGEIKTNDTVFIYAPTTCSVSIASGLAGAIISCACKDITMCIPYIFSIGSAYLLSYAKKIEYSPYDIMICKLDDICVGGGMRDTDAVIEMHKHRFRTILKRLVTKGLLTNSEVEHMQTAQGQVACFCNDLVERYKKFNDMNK